MRLACKNPVTVGNKVIGGSAPLICLPLVAAEKTVLLAQAERLKKLEPDLLEWRIDGYDAAGDIGACLEALAALKAVAGSIPLIFTCRIDAEGGLRQIPTAARLSLITAAVKTGKVDIVDIELCNEPAFVEQVRAVAEASSTRLMLSHHDFLQTPGEQIILDRLVEARQRGADIAKVAVMPKDFADVLTLLGATLKARTGVIDGPIVTIAMGSQGLVTRMAGGLFGSDITFAVGECASAPGQIPIDALRQAMGLLYP